MISYLKSNTYLLCCHSRNMEEINIVGSPLCALESWGVPKMKKVLVSHKQDTPKCALPDYAIKVPVD